jgi:hypothetical protein
MILAPVGCLRYSPLNFGRICAVLRAFGHGPSLDPFKAGGDTGRSRELGTLRSPHDAAMISCGFSRINSSPGTKGGRPLFLVYLNADKRYTPNIHLIIR